MRFDKSKQLYNYWKNLCGDRLAPERNQIEPSDIRSLLGDTFILEIDHQAKYVVYRLAGSRLCAAYGRELKGLGYLVNWQEEDSLEVVQAITRTYQEFEPCVLSHHAQTEQNRFMEYETVLLPLLPISDGGTRILGISCPHKMAFWLGAEPLITNRLQTIRNLGNAPAASDNFNRIEPPSLQPQSVELEPEYSGPGTKRVGHLTLLDGGKS